MVTKKTEKFVERKKGRPSMYSPQLAEKICSLIREGVSERQISKMEGMPSLDTLWRWKTEHQDFSELSARARELSAEKFNDEALELRAELRDEVAKRLKNGDDFPKGTVEAYKVLMQESARQAAIRDDSRYGDRKRVTLNGKIKTNPVANFSNDELMAIAGMTINDEADAGTDSGGKEGA